MFARADAGHYFLFEAVRLPCVGGAQGCVLFLLLRYVAPPHLLYYLITIPYIKWGRGEGRGEGEARKEIFCSLSPSFSPFIFLISSSGSLNTDMANENMYVHQCLYQSIGRNDLIYYVEISNLKLLCC